MHAPDCHTNRVPGAPWLRCWRWPRAGASAQSEGGLYIAGAGFSFQVAAERALAQNPGGRRFFVLSLPPETAALDRLGHRVAGAGCVIVSSLPTACCWCASATSTIGKVNARAPGAGRGGRARLAATRQRRVARRATLLRRREPGRSSCGQRGLAPAALHLHLSAAAITAIVRGAKARRARRYRAGLDAERRDAVAVQAQVRHQARIRQHVSHDRLLRSLRRDLRGGAHIQQRDGAIRTHRPAIAGLKSL